MMSTIATKYLTFFILILIIKLINTQAIVDADSTQLANFFPFGISEKDSVLTSANQTLDVKINIKLEFFKTSYSSVYVSKYGTILFDDDSSFLSDVKIPLLALPQIACYWSNINLANRNSKIFYRVSRDANTLSLVTTYLSLQYFDDLTDKKFKPSEALIVTWTNVSENMKDITISHNFQTILATNGNKTFVAFVYDQLKWPKTPTTYLPQMGFDSGDGKNFFELDFSYSLNATQISSKTNLNTTGIFVFKISDNKIIEPLFDPSRNNVPKKSKTGIIVGVIIGIIAVIAIVILVFYFKKRCGSKNEANNSSNDTTNNNNNQKTSTNNNNQSPPNYTNIQTVTENVNYKTSEDQIQYSNGTYKKESSARYSKYMRSNQPQETF